ncbi:Adenosine deaminase-related growth factor-like protein [Operophtera brumata]|uniref:Adenosine deaminase-related growth factor-like protein n=1 Tax=Operophtera brumata TaxID=104452 RepID=A0A0L7KWI4_OPEBR|nr:Adenosine deaminase-related growth factor-like protein [Operophtera brumata]
MKEENCYRKNFSMMLGSDIVISDSEIKVNNFIMDLKYKELDNAFNHQVFNKSQHFFNYKDKIKSTELFKLLHQMPKGALLHAQSKGILSPDYVLELTYMDDLYVCFDNKSIQFKYAKKTPTNHCKIQWLLMKDTRYSSRFGSVQKFDRELRNHFSMVVDNPNEVYTNINEAWQKYEQYFITTSTLFCYKPVWEKFFYDTLNMLRKENVMYIDWIRSTI